MTEGGSSRSARVDVLLPSLDGGGAERDAIAIAVGLRAFGLETRLLVWAEDGPATALITDGLPVVRLPHTGRLNLPRALARQFDEHGTDVVISTLQYGNAAAFVARGLSRSKPKVIVTVHNHLHPPGSDTPARLALRAFLARRVYPSADALVVVSAGLAADIRRHVPAKHRDRPIDLIPNPILPRLRPGPVGAGAPVQPSTAREIVAIGRLTAQKDFATAIAAVGLLGGVDPVRLTILGEGPERRRLEELATHLPPGRTVELPGFVYDIEPYLERASLFLLSSRWEGLGNVIIEALDAGLPVVATDCDFGPRELLAGGTWGALVPPGNPPEMAAAISRTLQHPHPPPPSRYLEAFSADAVSRKYRELVERVLECR